MIDPLRAVMLAAVIRDLYAGAEAEVLQRVARRLARGIDSPGWAEAKALELAVLRRELETIVARLEREGPEKLGELLEQAHRDGAAASASLLNEPLLVRGRPAAVEALARARVGMLEQLHFPILRTGLDAYQATVAESIGSGVAGVSTRRQTAAAAMRRFADQGVGGFTDSSGRSWDLASYTEMATRSGIGQAHLAGRVDELQAHGHDLGIISDSPDECRTCRPWEGKIVSLSGRDARYPSLADARSAGVFHPNCTHAVGAYVPGLTRRFTSTANPLGEEERARQRELERQIRTWKRREAVAGPLDPDAAATAHRHVAARQAEMRSFVADTGRRRDYAREGLGAR